MDKLKSSIKCVDGCPPSMARYKEDPAVLLQHIWLLSVVIAFADVITSLSVASGNDSLRHGSKGAGFAAIWSMFMVIGISVYAYYALTKWCTPFAIGYLIGALLMMSQMFLTLFCVFVGLARAAEDTDDQLNSDNGAMAFFSFVLFVVYGVFGGLVFKHRGAVTKGVSDAPSSGGLASQTSNVGTFDPTDGQPAPDTQA
uniref:MARVEL domain-containing protein n=1 Tax=Florenciella parvula TaxID=236787 RepID=A0A7S2CT56_9STRA|mmetsp:Transcript_514/g.1268  ORF Transcript_514/g.1268 Transcript_514/m.1268 type:complete len:199 (+) Transcript_514:201-797(+)|eukprot:CAMPEP_0182547386 /NCGR_PEP_ID=MMETSP1323-20130603/37384_1 /TAXON_ID=236787 /ORGANISM="Florenciella parvula, Strain RCC1693" /LENGTH=198 /DNA_ID=CAMNT_0024758693 /DNA_START=496 /DNA_END=1092 /DNA_ORIENTATION=-